MSSSSNTTDSNTQRSTHPKGVIQQQNKNWGAQIYFNNERIWLGTFKSEKEAGMAYDSAALKLRNGNSDRNFPQTNLTIHESSFQKHFTSEAILTMIRDGSYPSRLANYIYTHGKPEQDYSLAPQGRFRERLFQKELTPSDVGKLNRLVIPKRAALKFFPPVPAAEKEVELTFWDGQMRVWRFRYCYWKSSQSFVFTRGWNRFVKVNELRSRDTLTFWICKRNQDPVIHVIEVTRSQDVEGSNGNSLKGEGGEDGSGEEQKKGFRLFGVQIL